MQLLAADQLEELALAGRARRPVQIKGAELDLFLEVARLDDPPAYDVRVSLDTSNWFRVETLTEQVRILR